MSHSEGAAPDAKRPLFPLALAALGVVYGDIGTSPLYTWNESVHHVGQGEIHVLGIASIIVWSLLLLVTVKYVGLVLNADNHGEGGVFALFSIIQKARGARWLGMALILAAGFLYGDGVITPAISVLSAIEGLAIIAPTMEHFVVPLTLVVLTVLFSVQWRGTAAVGRIFGTVMVVWFLSISSIGAYRIWLHPAVLSALSPVYAFNLLTSLSWHHLAGLLGAVVLAITGGEALYADLGHFGSKPIRVSWLFFVLPCLAFSYLGQGAFLLAGGEVIGGNVFYSSVPEMFRAAMIPLATAATIIASQALITGAFSLTVQGVNLGLFPRHRVVHTSADMEGQIYLPVINWMLWAGCCVLVIMFQRSSNLAAAYGMAVTTVMVVTSLAMIIVSRHVWRWAWPVVALVWVPLLLLDLSYFTANFTKILHGGIVPVVIGVGLFFSMQVWQWGRAQVQAAYRAARRMRIGELVELRDRLLLVPRTIVYMTSQTVDLDGFVPVTLETFLRKWGVVPKDIVLFTVVTSSKPYWVKRRAEVIELAPGIRSVVATFGYMEAPNVPAALLAAGILDCDGVVVGQEELHWNHSTGWRRTWAFVFAWLSRLATQAHMYFGLGGLGSKVTKVVVHVENFGSEAPRVVMPDDMISVDLPV